MKLYKYMAQRAASSFLQHLLLRVTPGFLLNDVFEFQIPDDCVVEIARLHERKKRRANPRESWLQDQPVQRWLWGKQHRELQTCRGVLSLSETPDNLLMWSHYTENHKGMVVELEVDPKNPFEIFEGGEAIPRTSKNLFTRVSYRKSRKFPTRLEGCNLDQVYNYYLSSKSDEWDYEKEHRFLLDYSVPTHLMVFRLWKRTTQMLQRRGIKKEALEMARGRPLLIQMDDNFSGHRRGAFWHSQDSSGDEMFFLKVKLSAVSRIILGTNSPLRVSPLVAVNANLPFSGFTGFAMAQINRERYELSIADGIVEVHLSDRPLVVRSRAPRL